MSTVEEVKSLIEAKDKAVADLRAEVDGVKSRVKDVIDEAKFNAMRDDLAAKITAAHEAKRESDERLSKIEAKLNRPDGRGDASNDTEMKSFRDYASGKSSDFERKSMSEGVNADGGFLVPTFMEAGIQARMRRTSPVRAIASVVGISSNRYEMLMERGDTESGWVGEQESRAETTSPTFAKVGIDVHELSALPKVTQRLIDDAGFDIGAYLAGRIADKFGRHESSAYVTGTGVGQPTGFLAYSTAATADSARAGGVLEHVGTGTSGAFDATNPADKVIDLFYKLQSVYRVNATWAMNSRVMATMHTWKGGDGRYLLRDLMGGTEGAITSLLGRPIVEMEDMPDLAANSLSVALGDFASGYTIVDNLGTRILRDPYSSKPYILFAATKRTGGGVTDFDAIKLLKFI